MRAYRVTVLRVQTATVDVEACSSDVAASRAERKANTDDGVNWSVGDCRANDVIQGNAICVAPLPCDCARCELARTMTAR